MNTSRDSKRSLRSSGRVKSKINNEQTTNVTKSVTPRRKQSKPLNSTDCESDISPNKAPPKNESASDSLVTNGNSTPIGRQHKRLKRDVDHLGNKSINGTMSQSNSDTSDFQSPNLAARRMSARKVNRLSSGVNEIAKKKVKMAKKNASRSRGTKMENPGPSSVIRRSETLNIDKLSSRRNDDKDEDVKKVVKKEISLNSIELSQCPLPCREPQFEQILKFLKDNIQEKISGCLYISGVPGSGKTAIVQSVLEILNSINVAENPQFKYVYINGLSLGSPDRIWKRFYHGLHHDKIKLTSSTALKKLESYFETKGNRLPVVLVVDELDQLLDKQQSILYNLLEWASHPATMFSLVSIFNTNNIPETVFASRNSSRMGFSRVIFPPYNHEQLQMIVSKLLDSHTTTKLDAEAIQLLSRKVAALSGDARRAIEISKRAVEIVEESSLIGVKAVDEAFKEIFSSPKIDTVKDCSMFEQIFLKTVSNEQQRTGVEETTLMTVQAGIVTQAAFEGIAWSVDQFLNAASKLVSMKLIVAENDSSSLHKKISLNIPIEDINYALGINTTMNGHGHK